MPVKSSAQEVLYLKTSTNTSYYFYWRDHLSSLEISCAVVASDSVGKKNCGGRTLHSKLRSSDFCLVDIGE